MPGTVGHRSVENRVLEIRARRVVGGVRQPRLKYLEDVVVPWRGGLEYLGERGWST